MIDFAPAGPRRRDGAAPAARRRDLVPGLLGTGHGQQPGLARVPGDAHRRAAGGSTARRCGRAWPSTPQRCVLLTRTGTPGVGAPGHHRVLRRHGQPGHHRAADRDDARRRRVLARCSSTTSSCRSTASSARSTAAGPSPWTCCPTSAARRCGTARPTCSGGWTSWWPLLPAGALDPAARRRGHRAAVGLPGPVARHPAPPGRGRDARGPRPRSTRCSWRRPSRRSSTWSADGLGDRPRARRRPGQRALARRVPLLAGGHIYGGSAEIQRNIIARRLLDLGGRPLMDDAERALFAEAVRRATASASGEALDAALAELGWLDALADDPPAAVSVLFEARARRTSTSSALDRVLARRAGRRRWRRCPARRGPAPAARGRTRPAAWTGDRCAVRGLATAPRRASRHGARRRPLGRRRLRRSWRRCPTLALQPVRGHRSRIWAWSRSTGNARRRPSTALGRPTGTARWRWASWPSATSSSGSARAMLELARLHALDRIQFGRPIGSFQAVRHRLAESLVAVEAAAALLDAAWDEPVRRQRPPWPRAWPDGRPARWPATASRCSPASASRPSTRSTASSGGRSCSTSSSAPAPC